MSSKLAAAIIGTLALSLSACGGGEEDSTGVDEGDDDASGAGIWAGTYRVDGASTSSGMAGLVTEEGDFALVTTGTPARRFFGTGSTNGNSFSANAVGYSSTGTAATSLAGTITEGVSINGSYSLTGESATFTLTYDSLYVRSASLATLAGTYTYIVAATETTPAIILTVAVTSTGSFVYTHSTSGCTITGTFTVPHANRNYYRWTGTAAGCGADGSLSGIAHLGDNTSGQNRLLSMYGQNQAQTSSLWLLLPK